MAYKEESYLEFLGILKEAGYTLISEYTKTNNKVQIKHNNCRICF